MAADAPDGLVPAASARGQQALDQLINAQRPLACKSIARARRRNPEATPAQVICDHGPSVRDEQ